MNDVPDTELFSAYLDGELTADEQVRVEQMLAASPVVRQTLEELRAVGIALQGLPQQKLDEDLSARVLEVAERRMLLPDRLPDLPDGAAGAKPSAGRAAEALDPKEGPVGWLGVSWREISWRGMFSKRALMWSGVIAATAVIISFTSPPPKKANRDFATRDELNKRTEAAAPSAAGQKPGSRSISESRWEPRAGEAGRLADKEMEGSDKSRKAGASKAAAGADLAKSADRPLVEGKIGPNHDAIHEKVVSAEKKRALPLPEAIAKSGAEAAAPPPAAAPMAPAASPTATTRLEAAKPESPADAAGSSLPAVAKTDEPVSGKSSGGPGRVDNKRGPEKSLANDAPISGDSVAKDIVAKGDIAKDSGVRDRLMNGSNSTVSNGNSPSAAAAADRNRTVDQPAAATIVSFGCSPPAAQNKVFESLLEKSGVGSSQNLDGAWQYAPAGNAAFRGGKQLEQGAQGNLQSPPAAADLRRDTAAKAEGVPQDNAKRLQQKSPENLSDNSNSVRDNARQQPASRIGPAPIVYQCDVSQEQLGIILKQIKSRSDFFSVQVVDGPFNAAQAANIPAAQGAATPAQNNSYGGNLGGGAIDGGGSAHRRVEQQRSKAAAGTSNVAPEPAAQSQALAAPAPATARQQTPPPAAAAARQHVVFILNVVDRMPPAAGQMPAAPPPAQPPAGPAKP